MTVVLLSGREIRLHRDYRADRTLVKQGYHALMFSFKNISTK